MSMWRGLRWRICEIEIVKNLGRIMKERMEEEEEEKERRMSETRNHVLTMSVLA